jgi:predicted transcriptional regulator
MVQIVSMSDSNDETMAFESLIYDDLVRLGLSKLAVCCYGQLAEHGPITAGQLAKELGRARSSIYHALQKLELWGFVKAGKSQLLPEATRFKAVRLDKALENLAIHQRQAVRNLMNLQIEKSIKLQSLLNLSLLERDWR